MVKWADFGISRVHYNKEHTNIVEVKRRKDSGESLGNEEPRSRQDVVNDLKSGVTYVTIIETSPNNWKKGKEVGIVKVQGVEYIRTDKNETASDNLEELPEY